MFQFGVGGTSASKSSVYRETLYIPLEQHVRPIISITTAGMPLEVVAWDGEQIKVEAVCELPLIVTVSDDIEYKVSISQDESFAISLFTFDLFRYKLKVSLPRAVDYREIFVRTNSGDITFELTEPMLVMLDAESAKGEMSFIYEN